MVPRGDVALINIACGTILRERKRMDAFEELNSRMAQVLGQQVSVLKTSFRLLETLKLCRFISCGVKTIRNEMESYEPLLFPGPHTFLHGEVESSGREYYLLHALSDVFGKKGLDYCMVLFIDDARHNDLTKNYCLKMCGGRLHILQNTDKSVYELFTKIEAMTQSKDSDFFTNHLECFRQATHHLQKEFSAEYEEQENKLRKELNDSKGRENQLNKELNDSKDRENQDRENQLNKELNESKGRENQLNKELNESNSRENQLNKELNESKGRENNLNKELDDSRDRENQLNRELNESKGRQNQLNKEFTESNGRDNQLNKELKDSRDRENQLNKELEDSKGRKKPLNGDLDESKHAMQCSVIQREEEVQAKEKELHEREKEVDRRVKKLDDRQRNQYERQKEMEIREREVSQRLSSSGKHHQSTADTPSESEHKDRPLDECEGEPKSRDDSQTSGSHGCGERKPVRQNSIQLEHPYMSESEQRDKELESLRERRDTESCSIQ
ncbi:uncharacterized protein [Garra rufa]|uniref:uncharacterized protein n=1 Tax=Garra rufa TaxID=137080 RepID=UPI003CCE9045